MRSLIRWGCVCLLTSACALGALAQNPMVTVEDARKALAGFLADPLKESAKDDAKKIVTFAMESPDVVVVMGEEETAWIKENAKNKKDYAGLLLAAFIAGNIQTQLDLGEKRNDVYSGAIQVMKTYREIRKKDPEFQSPAVEGLLKKHRDGTLLRHLAEIQEKRDAAVRPKGIKQ
ncbi:MAG: hypothetical protein K2X38_05825 [Gemmataceae bacterium]|nr:hypothetical protein [Gemmataceae bacterium]